MTRDIGWIPWVICWGLVGYILSGCTQTPTTRPQDDVRTGDAGAFLRNPALRSVGLSPGGTHVAGIRSAGLEDAIVVFPVANPSAPRVILTERRNRGRRASRQIVMLHWANDERLLYSIETPYRNREDSWKRVEGRGSTSDENLMIGIGVRARKTRLYATDLEGNERWIGRRWRNAGHSQFQDLVISWLRHDPDHILVDHWGDAVAVDVSTGAIDRVAFYRGGFATWIADHQGRIRLRGSFTNWSTEQGLFYRDPKTDRWETLIEFDAYSEPGFWFAGYHQDPSLIYVYADMGATHDKHALFEYELEQRRLGRMVLGDPRYDIDSGSLLSSPIDGRLLAVYYYAAGLRMHIVDDEWRRVWEPVSEQFPGLDVQVLSFDSSATRILLRVSSDRVPPSVHLYDAKSGEIRLLFESYPELADRELAPMQAVRYVTRDGLEIEGFVTRPLGVQNPGPTIVFLHDGPEARDSLGWNAVVQFLVSRGFTVFQPNFRGSLGYGSEHAARGDGEWGDGIQDDITDGVAWLVAKGIADRDRIGIFGEGFGGYSALMGLVSMPGLYRAGASLGGITDLGILTAQDAKFFRQAAINRILVGDAHQDRERLARLSPARQAERIRVPVLLGHGTENDGVHESHTQSMTRALRHAGIEVSTYLYKGATNHFLDDRDRIDFYRRLARFFERHMGRSATGGPESAPGAPSA